MATGEIRYLETLLSEDCWQLFVKHAFKNNVDLHDYQDLQVIGKKIVEKCKGLPLAIKSLGGLLRSERNSKKWEDILNSDTWEELYKNEGSILPALWLSYRHLPAHLKRCFAYCSIFPKDYSFDRENLILLWMAEGFLETDKKYKKMEELGEEYLQDLLSRSFFQSTSHTKALRLQMHDLVHDLAIFVSYDFCFRLHNSSDIHDLPTKIRHLSYMEMRRDDDYTLKSLSVVNCLRTFIPLSLDMFGGEIKLFSYDIFFKAGSFLRVLSLPRSLLKKLPDSIGNLKQLRYLEASVANLIDKKGLLKLILSWNENGSAADNSQEEKDILDAIRPHTNLRYLMIENYRGTTFSDWIGDSAFSNLEEIWLMNCKNCCILPQFGQLPCLKDLYIIGCDNVISVGDDWNNYTSPLFSCLERISFAGILEWKDWSFSSEAMQQGRIFPLLKSLTLCNCPKLNVGIPGYLPSLEYLIIFECEQMAVLLPRTQQTIATPPSLVSPHERSCPVLESQLDGGSQWKVKRLRLEVSKMLFENRKEWDLHRFSSLEDFSISDWEAGSFPDDGLLPTTLTNLEIQNASKLETLNGKAFQQLASLTELRISDCENLRCLPEEGLPTSLSSLEIEGCPLLKQRCEEGGEDWNKIQHINSVESN